MSFLPPGYELPKKPELYFKLQQGDNRVRILGDAVVGYVGWTKTTGGECIRKRMDEDFAEGEIAPDTHRHFWAVPVWNYGVEAVQIWEITQSTIQEAITALTNDDDWGNPLEYDLSINKTGEQLKTEYTVNPKPKAPLTTEAENAWNEAKEKINLEGIFEGKKEQSAATSTHTDEGEVDVDALM